MSEEAKFRLAAFVCATTLGEPSRRAAVALTTVDVYIRRADGGDAFSLHNGLFGAGTTALQALISRFQHGRVSGLWHSSYIDTTVKGAIVRSILDGISELDPPYHQPGERARFATFREASRS